MPRRNNKFELTRIYQGRITDVKILSSQNNWMVLENWEEKIWEHHCLFQDAVNYYTVGLALMADPDDEMSANLSPMEKFAKG